MNGRGDLTITVALLSAHLAPTHQPATHQPARGTRSLGYLPGIDGLRAVSVVAVLLFHADLTWIPGGFLGVEVFFVISGYLITLLLLKEYAATGTISLRSFWLRRARRLLPAMFAVVLATTFVVWTFYREEFDELRAQIWAALTYCTNWYEIVAGHRYFAAAGRPPMLTHLWSLAVEEQFYLVWPVVLLVLIKVLHNRRGALAIVVGLGAIGSALLMVALYDPVNPNRVYLGTDTRASSLLLGATLAFLWRPGERTTKRLVLPDVAVVGAVAGLVVCFLTIRDYDRFLYPKGFLLISALTMVAIAGVVHPSAVLSRLLFGNPVMTWIGVRSYGLYLWHWPIFVLTRPGVDIGWSPGPTLALRLGLTVIATELSYRLVEVPIRSGSLGRWFAGMRAGDRRVHLKRAQITFVAFFGAALIMAPAFAGGSVDTGSANDITSAPTTTSAPVPTSAPSDTINPAETTAPAETIAKGTVTVIADSVLLRVQDDLTRDLSAAGWTVDYRGKSALMVKKAREIFVEAGTPVGDDVVIGLGYNSLWEHDRVNYDNWAAQFDREAEELLTTLSGLGAKRFVWVTVREPDRDIIPKGSAKEYQQYAWFFPYVNERLRLLAERRPDVVLADWAAISNVPGITGDLIHLNAEGFRMMSDLIFATGGF